MKKTPIYCRMCEYLNRTTESEQFRLSIGSVAQLVEQWPFKPFVVGSSPTGPTNKKFRFIRDFLLVCSSGARRALTNNNLFPPQGGNNRGNAGARQRERPRTHQ